MTALPMALRNLRSLWRAGEIRVMLAALVLAVAALSAVGFFADRIESALARQGSVLLGGDLKLSADHPLPPEWLDAAAARGLRTAPLMEFPSMALVRGASQLAEIKAVAPGYPLRGALSISETPYGTARVAAHGPGRGQVWLEPRLASALQARVGDRVTLGEQDFTVAAILEQDPARGGDLFNIAPQLLMNLADVPATGLIQYGSRVSYQLLLAGPADALAAYQDWLAPRLGRGERMEDVRGARPEVRAALDKTRQFLGLAAMSCAILAIVALSLAALRFAETHLDTCAMLRCFGASQAFILRVLLWQTAAIAALGGAVGLLGGYGLQELLAGLAGRLYLEALPPPTWWPAASSFGAGLLVLFSVMLPHLLRLRGVPALRILRRDLAGRARVTWLAYLPLWCTLLGLIFVHARDARLGAIVLAGLAAMCFAVLAAGGLARLLLRRALPYSRGPLRLGLLRLLRHPASALAQVAGFSLGLMALLLLTVVRGDLLASWQASLPPDAPNRFVINIQPDQLAAVRDFFRARQRHEIAIFPMVRGRLTAINGVALDPQRYADERARRLATREFNLSWAAAMQDDNRLRAGRWWTAQEHGRRWLSLEQGIAETLGIRLGDRLRFDVAGNAIEVTVTSLREVEWDSMRVNFFAVTPPGVLEQEPASYITSFHLPKAEESLLQALVARFPNLTVIDVAAILQQLRGIMDKMAYAVQAVFALTLLMGVVVLYAALTATQSERQREAALMRVLGADRRQVLATAWTEFALIGLLAGLLAAAGAGVLGWLVSREVLQLAYAPDPWLLLAGLAAALGLPLAAWPGLRRILGRPPKQALQSV